MKNINVLIVELVSYAQKRGLIEKEDRIYAVNRLCELFCLDEHIV